MSVCCECGTVILDSPPPVSHGLCYGCFYFYLLGSGLAGPSNEFDEALGVDPRTVAAADIGGEG